MLPIIFTTDHNYVMQTGVCICSLMESARDVLYDINVIVSEDVTDADKDSLRKQVARFPGHSIGFVVCGKEFENGYQTRGITTAAYYRLLIPWLFPHYDKVIYSDVDVIFHTSLADAYDVDLGDSYVAAVPGVNSKRLRQDADHARELGLDPDKYVNSGFLVVNSALQRQDDLRPRYLELSRKNFFFQDQDILNIVCKDRIVPLSPRYCVVPAFYEMLLTHDPMIEEFYGSRATIDSYLRGEDCILHYAGPKPWNTVTFAWIDWWETYRRSAFRDPAFELSYVTHLPPPKVHFRDIVRYFRRKIKL